jgi:alpha-glucosidase
MKKIALLICLSACLHVQAQHALYSPDNQIELKITNPGVINFSVHAGRKVLIPASPINLIINGKEPSNLKIKSATRKTINTTLENPIPERRKIITDHYNSLHLKLDNGLTLECRAYNDGVAWRWISGFKDSIIIKNEVCSIQFADNFPVIYPEVEIRSDTDSFHTSFEDPYKRNNLDSISNQNLLYTPLLVAPATGYKMLITESDIEEYPGLFFRGSSLQSLEACFAKYPDEEYIKEGEFPQSIVKTREDFIAKTKGTRTFPWRVIILSKKDTALASSDMVYRLASPSRVNDLSWINPGQGTDEWIIGISLFNVPFKAGINTATYKYYIDFAKKSGLERIMLDAGWSDYKDLFKINPDLNMDELAAYAREKGIKLSMWTLAMTLDKQLEPALEQFSKWGVDFIMTDFMDRDDQKMVQFYHRIAEACAKKKIMVMYHGAFKTAGFNRTWPNAITREGVLGSEYNIWSAKATPDHDLLLPFIRMAGGPMDYEPGLLDNATQQTFRPISGKVMSQGTRCHQLAMFLVYESPIQIFSGNPSQGLMEPDFMELLGSVSTTWDETIVLDGAVGEYIITARRKGNDWFVGAMSGWQGKQIKKLSLSFLGEGIYDAIICADGINAGINAIDYNISKLRLSGNDFLDITMAKGGGWLMRLKKVNTRN